MSAEPTDAPARDAADAPAAGVDATTRTTAPAIPRPSWLRPDLRVVVVLAILALASRLVWVLWLHPPGDYVFSDMGQYVLRASRLVKDGFVFGDRTLAWQSFGTHYLLALFFKLFGGQPPYTAAAVLYALMGAAAVPLGYLVACRTLSRQWMAIVVGAVLLVWYPNLSTTGYFLSETPFLFFQLLATYWLCRVFQEGRPALAAGIAGGVCFMLRPQSAVFFVLVLVTWLIHVRRLPWVRARQIAGVAAPLLLALFFSLWRFAMHTGYWGGVAESANMNLTAGRCHNIVTQAFPSEEALKKSARARNTRDGRRVSVPGLRALGHLPPDHPLALRPALQHESIRFVGYIGDPFIHRKLQRACYARTGLWEQIRYTLGNISLQWYFAHQWPDQEPSARWTLRVSDWYRWAFQAIFLGPSLLGMALAIAWVRRAPTLALVGWQILGSIVIAGIFFGDIRLRTPYDPYAIILAVLAVAWVGERALRLWRRLRRASG